MSRSYVAYKLEEGELQASRQKDIDALLKRAAKDLKAVEVEYSVSLQAKDISSELRIDIKNLCENLRSVLDYLAQEIRAKYCPAAKKKRFYFPVLPDRRQFEVKMDEWFPGLRTAAPALWDLLESVQPYNPFCQWLGHFNLVNNENKHAQLVEQTRLETPRVEVSFTHGQVSWDPRAVKFGSGVFIGGVPVDPRTQLPVPNTSLQVKRIVWVDFLFAEPRVSALQLLRDANSGVGRIAAEARRLLE